MQISGLSNGRNTMTRGVSYLYTACLALPTTTFVFAISHCYLLLEQFLLFFIVGVFGALEAIVGARHYDSRANTSLGEVCLWV